MSYSGTTAVFPPGVATVNVSTIRTEGGPPPQYNNFIEYFRAEATNFDANLYKFKKFVRNAEWWTQSGSNYEDWDLGSNPYPGEGSSGALDFTDEKWWSSSGSPSSGHTVKKVTAYFAKKITVSVSHIGSGEAGISGRMEESVTDFNDMRFSLRAIPSVHWRFVEWRESGVAVSTDPYYYYRPDFTSPDSLQDRHFVAVFEPIPGDILVRAERFDYHYPGEVKINDSEWNDEVEVHITAGDGCVLEARPLDGCMFHHWLIDYYDEYRSEEFRTKRVVLSNIQSRLYCYAYFRRCTHLLVNSSTVGSPVRLVYDDRPGGTGKLVADY